jgi:DNA polymerase-3 subunit delta'
MQWLKGSLKHGTPEVLLALANGAPLKALALDDPDLLKLRNNMLKDFLALAQNRKDPVKIARHWGNSDAVLMLEWMMGWVIDLHRLKVSAASHLFNPDFVQALQKTADKINPSALQHYLLKLYYAKGMIDSNINLQLTIEKLLIEWQSHTQDAI